eukprot:TRINITY_DN835_c0_g1_i4.p1 TRINITY_DN835_c0_g1~~TRINITY_DN835_c0_g1_i4.p1  ORF type:complete len:358 (+),score=115.92 TRINITY_DN835_c0_g1_i4:78-1151(+)
MGKGVKRKAADVPVEDFGFAPDSEDGIDEIKSAKVKVMKKKKQKTRPTKNTKKESATPAPGKAEKAIKNKNKGKVTTKQDSNSEPSSNVDDTDDTTPAAASTNAEKNKKKKERKKRAKGKKADLFGDAGWTPVEVDLDAMLTGDNEGFFGLEELDSSKFRIHASAGGAVSMEELPAGDKVEKEASKGKEKTKGRKDATHKDKKGVKDSNKNNNSNKNKTSSMKEEKGKGKGKGKGTDSDNKQSTAKDSKPNKKQASKEGTGTQGKKGNNNQKSQGRNKGDSVGPAPKALSIDTIPDTPTLKTGPQAVSVAQWEQYGLCTEILVALQDQVSPDIHPPLSRSPPVYLRLSLSLSLSLCY